MKAASQPISTEAPAGAVLAPVGFRDLPGWERDDVRAAFDALRAICAPIISGAPALRGAREPSPELVAACKTALHADIRSDADARGFFENHFTPHRVTSQQGSGFVTGYYEPEVAGSLTLTAEFSWPLRARPHNLVTLTPETALQTHDGALLAALETADHLKPVPDRDAIENGALGHDAPPLVYVRDETEALLIHVQGSTRIRLPDGKILRLAYNGRNGYPFTSPARLIVTEFGLKPDDVTMEKLKDWLRSHGDIGRALIRRNRSYIFFRIADELRASDGPIGGAGVPLTAGRSLAVDRSLWSYGLPIFIRSDAQGPDDAPLQRLMVAQDTGAAIVGPARGDVFFGSGAAMGARAGIVRHAADFFVLLPK